MTTPIPLVRFDNGQLVSVPDDLSVQVFKNKNDETQRLVSIDVDGDKYVGRSKEKRVEPCKFFIAVRKRGATQFFDAEQFNLQQCQGRDQLFEDITPDLSYREKSDQLISAFGSSKRKKAMRSRQLNEIQGGALDTAMEVSVMNSTTTPTTSAVSNSSDEVSSSEYLPPFDKDASRPQDVYNINDIITPVEYESLKSLCDELMTAKIEQMEDLCNSSQYGYFVAHHVPMLQDVPEEKKLDISIKLKYLNYLMKFYSMDYKQIRSNIPFPNDIPTCVKNSIIAKFTQKTVTAVNRKSFSRPKKLKDKLLMHILILAMMIDDYLLQIHELMIDLKITLSVLTNYLKHIGATVKKTVTKLPGNKKIDSYVAEISIPLTFPVAKKAPSKKSR